MAQLELLKPLHHSLHAAAKSDSAYRTISEVAEELDVPQHVLRFWESHFPQVKPSRMRGSRRYYRPEDVDQLKRIKSLLYEKGFTIKGAKKFMRGKDDSFENPADEAAASAAGKDAAPARQEEKSPARKMPRQDVKLLINELRVLKAMLGTLL